MALQVVRFSRLLILSGFKRNRACRWLHHRCATQAGARAGIPLACPAMAKLSVPITAKPGRFTRGRMFPSVVFLLKNFRSSAFPLGGRGACLTRHGRFFRPCPADCKYRQERPHGAGRVEGTPAAPASPGPFKRVWEGAYRRIVSRLEGAGKPGGSGRRFIGRWRRLD